MHLFLYSAEKKRTGIRLNLLHTGGSLCTRLFEKETLADNIILMDIKAPRVANECLPGQFIIAKTDEVGRAYSAYDL